MDYWEQLVFLDTLGAVTTAAIYLVCILVFTARLLRRPELAHKIGWAQFVLALPLLVLLLQAPGYGRATARTRFLTSVVRNSGLMFRTPAAASFSQ